MKSRRLGRYELLRVLGRGAMGIVYEARDPNLDRRVAIKTVKVEELQPGAAADYEERFRTEARSAARMQHPHIVSVYDWDRDGNTAFLVMEYVEGRDLKHDLDRGTRFALGATWGMVRELLSALGYAHARGIVHRDIKPANLLLASGAGLKLTDFGVARIQDGGDVTRTQGSMIGTLKYMAPEQVQGLKVDARADLFSAGVVLYQLLTDRRPFDADNDFSVIQQVIGSEPPPPSSLNPGLTPAIDAVVAQALAKDREQRFATAEAFAEALRAAVESAPDLGAVPPEGPRPARAAGAASVPGATPTRPSVPGLRSSITQELELVYWKDVRESTDPEELESFLDRFPDGIYADLARKRLRRLLEGPLATDATALNGLAPAPGTDVPVPPDIVDLVLGPLPTAAPAAAAGPDGSAAGGSPAAAAGGEGAASSGVAPAAGPAPAAAATAARARATRPKRRGLVLLGLAVLLAAALAGWRAWEPAPAPAEVAASASSPEAPALEEGGRPAPATEVQPAGAASAAAMAPASVAGTHAVAPAQAQAGSSTPAAPAPARTASHLASSHRTHDAASPPRTAEVPLRAPSSVADAPARQAPAANAAAVPPEPGRPSALAAVEACRDRLFLMRELCLVDACARPGTRNHPLCVKHREEVRLRTEGNPRN